MVNFKKEAERLLAQTNLEVVSKLRSGELNFRQAEERLYNMEVGEVVDQMELSEICQEMIWGYGMQLEDFEEYNPEEIPSVLSALQLLSEAILDKEKLIAQITSPDSHPSKLSTPEVNALGYLQDQRLDPLFLRLLQSPSEEMVEAALIALRRNHGQILSVEGEEMEREQMAKEKRRWLDWWAGQKE